MTEIEAPKQIRMDYVIGFTKCNILKMNECFIKKRKKRNEFEQEFYPLTEQKKFENCRLKR